MLGLNVKSAEGLIYSQLGWSKCGPQIDTYEACLKTGTISPKNPTECYSQAKSLQLCYANKGMQIQPLCLPIFNDVRQCMFQSDSHLINCKQEINELRYCQQNPIEYKNFLKWSTDEQKKQKVYNYFTNISPYES